MYEREIRINKTGILSEKRGRKERERDRKEQKEKNIFLPSHIFIDIFPHTCECGFQRTFDGSFLAAEFAWELRFLKKKREIEREREREMVR